MFVMDINLSLDIYFNFLQGVNMMSVSEDTHTSELATNGVRVKSTLPPDENRNKQEKGDVTPNKATSEHRAAPAWLDKETNQGPSKLKLPPVTVPGNKKRKGQQHRNPGQNSKGKLNVAIEPVQEEVMESNANA